ncbi:uncharacterized protein BDZ99DRAFT_466438 [Mytilinidion resinicola]|uniref:Uncharacterized protein n=1 Tax=Mytilinidion resinicola TaxID=574789 RepID=A0A6A6YC58_9PEZI|nr:uncharacterized protein BDZ99DRAFT_466438 [Mytilinidion resinicola]KAF2805427.1 hypothetical protein BDZ99DRAFT_466438 [Mytilinidion resinicola]
MANATTATRHGLSFLDMGQVPLGKAWVCLDQIVIGKGGASVGKCNMTALGTSLARWTLNSHRVSYCLSDPQPARCTVQFSITLLWSWSSATL